MNNNSEFMPVECLNVPKVLFYDKQYEDLSMDAKLIYALLLDRKEMAIRNEWVDEYGDTYVIYPKQEIKKYLNISRYRIDQALAELEEHDQMVEVAVPYPGKLCQFYVKDITDNEKQMEEDIMKKMKESNGENFCRASGCGYARCFTGISPKYMAKMNKEDRNTYYVYQKSKAEEQKQKQLLMTAAEEADAANKAKSAFLLSMSHDIRTPMNAIIGFTNIALHQNTVSDIHDSLEKVQKSSNHLLSLLNDVLDFTRIESGKVTISPEPVDITQLTDNVQAIMNGLLYNRDLKFEVHRESPKNPYVLADVARIREVLVNLLGNAVKFTKDGGKITLDISTYPGTDEKHIIIRYVVQDNGIGMSEEFQKELFKPFSQEDNANARTKYKGTGLGMAITQKYVDIMGGSIAVESKKGV